jgi:multidrug resistance efflux pump
MSATIRNALPVRSGLAILLALKRMLKLAAACSVLAAGGYAIWSAQRFVVSDNAVVSAYVIALRAPIEGYVSTGRTQVGAEIQRGDVLATIANPLVDDQHLTDLEDRVQRLAMEEAAVTRQRAALEATQDELMQRAAEYRRAMLARLSGQVVATKMALEAKQAESEQARHDYARKVELARSGTASPADLDRSQSAFEALDRQAQSLAGQLIAIQAQMEAADHGVMTEPGGNDVAYSVQRADEVRLRLAELDRTLDTVRNDAAEANSRLAAERRRISRLRSATMAAPSAGMLWKIGAADGERLGIGDATAELVDCSAAFLVATIPQTAYTDVAPGSEARFRLSGETFERTGKVISVTGDASLIGDRNLAAVPADQHRPTVMVRIAVPPSRNSASECLVGRAARVLLPTAERSIADIATRLVQRIF